MRVLRSPMFLIAVVEFLCQGSSPVGRCNEQNFGEREGEPAVSTQAARSDARIFMFDPDAETMPREALSVLQTTRLKQTLQRA